MRTSWTKSSVVFVWENRMGQRSPAVPGGRGKPVPALKKPVSVVDWTVEVSRRRLKEGAAALEISLLDSQINAFMEYLNLLEKWNRTINLTGLQTRQEMIVKHFLDSLTIIPYLPETFRLLDLGSGAGLPGLPIKIMRPDQEVTLIEASAKKASFLREAVRRLHLPDLFVVHLFLSTPIASRPELEKPFDIMTSRAVGRLPELLSLAQNLLSMGGKLMLLKGKKGLEEIMAVKDLTEKMGFQIEEPVFRTLPFLNQERTLIFLTRTGSLA